MDRHEIYQFDAFQVDPHAWRLLRNGREVHLEPIVLKLLIYLISHRDRLVPRRELIDTVWRDTVISDSALSQAVARLRKALDDDPRAPRYIETVHSQGFRFIAGVEEVESDAHPDHAAGPKKAPATRKAVAVGIIAVAVLIGLIILWPEHVSRDSSQSGDVRSLAVLPLNNLTGNPEQDYFIDGMQDTLITELSQIPELRVISRQSTMRYRGSDTAMPEIARELGVEALVEGSVLRIDDQVEVNLQLVRGHSDEHLWAARYEREAAHIFELFREVAAAIAPVIGLETTGRPAGPIDPRATRAYWRGLGQMDRATPGSLQVAIEQFQLSVSIEPGFSLAWGNLAAAYAMYAVRGQVPSREAIENARAAAMKAIAAGDNAYIGYAALGWVRLWTLDLPGACEAFHEALRINPSAPFAMHGDADCLLLNGHMDESVERTRELAMINPFTFVQNLPLSFHLYLARRYDEALEVTLGIQERFPNAPVHTNLFLIYWAQNLFDEALEEERQWLRLQKDDELLAALERGLADAGPTGAQRAMAETLVARSGERFVNPFRISEAFARAGAVEEALFWLDRAAEEGSFELTHLAFRQDFEGLQSDPRFQELLTRKGLRQAPATPQD